MKATKILGAATAVILLLPTWARGGGEEFDAGKMLSDLEKQLRLSKEELEKLRPELERALESKSRELKETVDRKAKEGYLEIESAMKELEKASREAEDKLGEALNSEQVEELKAYLGKLDREAVEEVRRELVAEMAVLLELTEKQVKELEPILKEQVEKTAELVDRFARDSGRAVEEFRKDFAALARESRQSLEKALDPAQLEKLEKRLEENREKIGKKLFPE